MRRKPGRKRPLERIKHKRKEYNIKMVLKAI
jgi:hypothetical protein